MPPSSAGSAGAAARRVEAPACSDDTRQRLLDAAERLFAERGYDGTSMRALAERAGTSVSAANYHFGGKHALLREVLSLRLSPINAVRMQRIEAVEAEAAPGPAPLEALIDAFLRPSFEAWAERDRQGDPVDRHISALLHAGPHDLMAELKLELFGPLMRRLVDALERTLPDQSRDELRMGAGFMVGVLLHVLGGHLEIREQGIDAVEDEEVLRRMVAFCAAGLRAKVLVPKSAEGGR